MLFFSEHNAQSENTKIWRVVCQEHAYFLFLYGHNYMYKVKFF